MCHRPGCGTCYSQLHLSKIDRHKLVGGWRPVNFFYIDTYGKDKTIISKKDFSIHNQTLPFYENDSMKVRYTFCSSGKGVNIYTYTHDEAGIAIAYRDSSQYLKVPFNWTLKDSSLIVDKGKKGIVNYEIIKYDEPYLILLDDKRITVCVRVDVQKEKLDFIQDEFYILPTVQEIIEKKHLNLKIIDK